MFEAIMEVLTGLGLNEVTDLTPTHVVALICVAIIFEAIADMVYALLRLASR